MKAIEILGDKATPHITLNYDIPKPVPKGRDILIKVHAAGITADEIGWGELQASSSRIPGHDISGVVEAFGPEYDGSISVGDEVYAMLRAAIDQGGQADYVIAAADEVALKPKSLSHAEAAALPIPALTAWEAITAHAKLKAGSKVLITGASGAVGVMLVQFAGQIAETEIIALASPRKHDRLKALGAHQVIDYNTSDWERGVKDVDAVFDTVGGSILSKTWETVKEDGSIITVADPAPHWAFGKGKPEELKAHSNVNYVYFIVTADGKTLTKVAAILDEGGLKPITVKTFPAEQGVQAWVYASQRGRDGKVVIEFVSG